MAQCRVFLIIIYLLLNVSATASAAPKKRAAQPTPPPVLAPLLRVENLAVIHRSSGSRSTTATISVRVVNRSAGEAREVSAYVVFKNGYALPLKGHRRIPGYGRVVYNGSAPLPPAMMAGPRVTLSCAGCRRQG
jgi:hypothetical protein